MVKMGCIPRFARRAQRAEAFGTAATKSEQVGSSPATPVETVGKTAAKPVETVGNPPAKQAQAKWWEVPLPDVPLESPER